MPVQLPDYHADGIVRLQPNDLVKAVGCTFVVAEIWAPLLSGAAVLHEINTARRLAPWLATLAHESASLSQFTENLGYSPKSLMRAWPMRFRLPHEGEAGDIDIFVDGMRNAYQYANNPEKLANYVYDDANRSPRNKLGNTEPGDGWLFIGRGPIQTTGRTNYTRCGQAIGVSLHKYPDLLLEPPIGARSAGWFWQDRDLNTLADVGEFENIVKRVNPGMLGYDDRLVRLNIAQDALERFV